VTEGPDERDSSVQALADELGAVTRSGNSVVIAAESDGELAGYVELTGGSFRRNKTTAYLGIGVLTEAGGRGVGARLLTEGRRAQCLVIDGQFVDELYMAAILARRDPK
jgi:hypothetical protein